MTLRESFSGTQLWAGRTKEFRTLPEKKDDPARHERLVATERIGETEDQHNGEDVIFCVPIRPEDSMKTT